MKGLRILHLEDELSDFKLMQATLAAQGIQCELIHASNEREFVESLQGGGFDLILADYSLPGFDGHSALQLARELQPDLPFIFLSGSLGEELAIEALKSGATDYVLKQRLSRLGPAVVRALQEAEDRAMRKQAESEVRKLEGQLRQAAKMEAIGTLAGGVAHDFNNLLTAINGYSDMLLGQLGANSPLRADIEMIRQAGEHAASLTRQLLAFSRRQVLLSEIVQLNGIVNNVGKILTRLIGEDVKLIVEADPALGLCKADPGQIEQVIMNLVVNSRDAMPHGGSIVVRTANVGIDQTQALLMGAQPGPCVSLSVSDTGDGMDAETLQHIFEPFFTTKGPGKGTGLGLAMVFGIVSQSGGHVVVDSKKGVGSTFTVYLPRIQAQPMSPTPKTNAEDLSLSGRESILLVEDDELVRSFAFRVLTEEGYEVIQASSGEEALGLCKSSRQAFQLLITDVVMKGMNGRELSDRAKAIWPTLKTLFISGYTNDAMIRNGVLEQQVSILLKPFAPSLLAGKVREVLGPHRASA